LKDKHLLLCTLLIVNAGTMETFPIFLAKIVPEWAAITISVTLILFVGEILPQALCTGPHGVSICYNMIWIMRFFIIVTFIVSWPLARLVDCIVGKEEKEQYTRRGLKTFINMQVKESDSCNTSIKDFSCNESGYDDLGDEKRRARLIVENGKKPLFDHRASTTSSSDNDDGEKFSRPTDLERQQSNRRGTIPQNTNSSSSSSSSESEGLMYDEVNVISGVLDMSSKKVAQIMTSINDLYMLEADTILNTQTRADITKFGFSRIPIYEKDPNNIIGTMFVKQLANETDETLTARNMINAKSHLLVVGAGVSLWTILKKFQTSRTHLAYVAEDVSLYTNNIDKSKTKNKKKLLGAVTLEDVIEEFLGEEIYDEFDTTGEVLGGAYKTRQSLLATSLRGGNFPFRRKGTTTHHSSSPGTFNQSPSKTTNTKKIT